MNDKTDSPEFAVGLGSEAETANPTKAIGELIRDARNLSFKVDDLTPPEGIDPHRADARLALLEKSRRDFLDRHPGISPVSHDDAYQRAVRLMRSSAAKAFELDDAFFEEFRV